MVGNICSKKVQRAKYIVSDLIMTGIAFLIFNLVRYSLLHNTFNTSIAWYNFVLDNKIMWEQVLLPPFMLLLYAFSGFYNNPFRKSRLGMVSNTLLVSIAGSVLVLLLILLNDASAKHLYYILILVYTFVNFFFVYLGRSFINGIFNRKLRSEEVVYTALIIGDSRTARSMASEIRQSTGIARTRIIGFVHLPGETGVISGERIWNLDDVKEVCRRYDPDSIIIATESKDDRKVMQILDKLINLDILIKIAPDTLSYITANIRMGDIMGTPLVDLSSPSISEFGWNVKRCCDIFVSSLALLLLSPVYLLLALSVKRSSQGPVIYSQERLGMHRKPFRIYKFRSMYVDAEANGPQLSSDNDSRITKVGELMRKYRLDELPQFWNVLKGDMSLVGPRPEREFYVNQIIERAPYFGLVFKVRPGITSWGMVKYGYASSVREMVARSQYDLLYLNNMSIFTDLKILAYTIRTVVTGTGK